MGKSDFGGLCSSTSGEVKLQVCFVFCFVLFCFVLFCFVLFSTGGIRQSVSVRRSQGISLKQREFKQLLGNIP